MRTCAMRGSGIRRCGVRHGIGQVLTPLDAAVAAYLPRAHLVKPDRVRDREQPAQCGSPRLQLMLPFFAILAVASIGQHLVIQQRGLDLSVAGIMSFAAVIVSALPSSEAGVPETLAFVDECLA